MANTSKYLLSKSDFTITGWSDNVVSENTHVPINFEQLKFVEANRAVNGPKVLHFVLTSAGMPADVVDAALKVLLRGEQKAQDDGAPAYVPPAETVAKVEELPPEAPAVIVTGELDPLAEVRKSLEAFEDKALLLKHAEATFGIKVPGNYGKERIIETVMAQLAAPKGE